MSDDPSASTRIDFDEEMKQLASQAGGGETGRAAEPKAAPARTDRAELLRGVGDMVRPLAVELEGLKRASSDNNHLLLALVKTIAAQKSVPQALEAMASQMQRLGSVESANQKLFDALHAELKTYKDNFLFDALQKPFIRDLVTLFDDFSAVHGQTAERFARVRDEKPEGDEIAFLERIHGNLENNLHHILEVFQRMGVTLITTAVGAPVDKKHHRAVSMTPAASPADDSTVDRSVRPGFIWNERPVRPEDVVVRRWTPAPPAGDAQAARETVAIPPVFARGGKPEVEDSAL